MDNQHKEAIETLEIRVEQLKAIVRDADSKTPGCDSNAAARYWMDKACQLNAKVRSIMSSIETLKNDLPF